MTRRKRTYPTQSLKKHETRPRKGRGRNVVFVILVTFFGILSFVFLGNKFLTTTKTCTVERVEYLALDSNSGGIVSQTPAAYIYSSNCPVISFTKVPEGFVSLEQLSNALVAGNSYEFKIGFFRAELLGFKDSSWRGVNINTPH